MNRSKLIKKYGAYMLHQLANKAAWKRSSGERHLHACNLATYLEIMYGFRPLM